MSTQDRLSQLKTCSLLIFAGWTAASGLPAWSQSTLPTLRQPTSSPSNRSTPTPLAPSTPSPSVPLTPAATSASINCDATQLPPIAPRSTTAGSSTVPPFRAPASALSVPKTPAEVAINATTPITLEQAIELARSRNRDLQIAALQVTQQREALRQVRASLYPVVDVQAGVTRTDSAQAAIAAKQLGIPRPNATNNFSGGPTLNYDVYTSGQRTASIRAAEAAVRSSEQIYRTQYQQLRLDVSNDYYDLQQAGDLIRISRQSVSSAEENLRVTNAREVAGIGSASG
jgi:Outer membrane efflux protein